MTDKPSAPAGPLKVSDVTEDSVDLEWKPPQSDGGSPLTYYYIEMRDIRKSTWTKVAEVKATATKYTVGKLSVDNEYMFRVVAVNAEGDSPPLTTMTTTAPVRKLSKILYCFWFTGDESERIMWIYRCRDNSNNFRNCLFCLGGQN